MKQIIKRAISLLLISIMIVGMLPWMPANLEASAAEKSVVQIKAEILSNYTASLKLAKKEKFKGYCGAYADCQLVGLGIIKKRLYGNGNVQFDNYKNLSKTTGGYTVGVYPSSDYTIETALNAISENGTKNVYNILVGFTTGSTSENGQRYGHVFFINAIIDGKVYFSESFSGTFWGVYRKEGKVISGSISQVSYYYRQREENGKTRYKFDGIIHFGGTSPSTVKSDPIEAGIYYIKNNSTNTYLTVADNKDAKRTNITLADYNGEKGQSYTIYKYNNSYAFRPESSAKSGRVVNIYSSSAKNGDDVNIWDRTNHSTQLWKFEAGSDGYYIHSANNYNCVLTANGNDVVMATYTGAANQVWELESVVIPTISKESFVGGKKLTFNSATTGATIYYSTNAGKSYTAMENGGSINLTETAEIRVYAEFNGARSTVYSEKIVVDEVNAPTINTAFTDDGLLMTIECGTEGADIYYTLDGSEPTESSARYNGGVYLTENAEVRAIAMLMGCKSSDVSSRTVTLSAPGAPDAALYNCDAEIAVGDEVTVSWKKVESATSYTATLYKNGAQVDICTTPGTMATFVLSEVGDYTIAVKATNFIGDGEEGYPPVYVSAMADVTVSFVDYDGTLIQEQTVKYGYDAAAPDTPPQRKGYTFNGWSSTNYTNVKKDTTITATYSINKYTVEFYDVDGTTRLCANQRVEYMSAAVPPTNYTIDEGYAFAGWSVKNDSDGTSWEKVDGNVKLIATQAWANPNLPMVVTITDAQRAESGKSYTASVSVKNSDLGDRSFKLIGVLKTSEDKTVATTIATKQITSDSSETYSLTIQYSDKATVFEAVAVAYDGDYKTGGALSHSASANIQDLTEWEWSEWSEWSTEVPDSYDDIEQKTQYRARDKIYEQQDNSSTLEGYTLRTDLEENPVVTYGSWSGWSDTKATASATQQVETKSVQATAAKTQYKYYGYKKKNTDKWHFCAKLGGGGTSTWELVYTDWMDSTISETGKVWTHGDCGYSNCKCPNTNDGGVVKTYGKYNGHYYYWYETRTVAATYKTQYRTRSITSTYYFYKWNDWCEWSDTSVSGDETESRTVYRTRSKITTNDPNAAGEDTTGTKRTVSGTLDDTEADLSGLTAAVMVYKKTNSDPTEEQLEYVGQTVIGENNSYSFEFIPREEPSADTGDFIVALGVEGAANLVNIDVIKAPGAEHTVTFIADGVELSVQTVSEGEAAVVPEVPEKTGYMFTGWSDRTTNINESVVITAQYIKREYYAAFVDFENDTISIETYEYGEAVSIPTPDEVEGKTFTGWSGFDDGSNIVTENAIHIAQWDTEEYTVTFYDALGNVISEQVVSYSDCAVLPEDPEADGVVFEGWSTNESWWHVNKDMSVYPIFRYAETVEAPTMEAFVGEECTVVLLSCETPDATIYYTVSDSDPYVDGVEFYYDEGIVVSSSDVTVRAYAACEGMNSSKVVEFDNVYLNGEISDIAYNANGGDGAPTNQVKYCGEALTLSEIEPTKENDIFLGWATTCAASEPEYLPGDTYEEEQSVTLYAVWASIAPLNADQKLQLVGSSDKNALTVDASMINAGDAVNSGMLVLDYDTDKLSISSEDIVMSSGVTNLKTYHNEENGYIGLKFSFDSSVEVSASQTDIASFGFSINDGVYASELCADSVAVCSDSEYLSSIGASDNGGAALVGESGTYCVGSYNLGVNNASVPLSVSHRSPQNIGETITLEAAGGVYYEFYYTLNGETVAIGEGMDTSCTWIPESSGKYLLCVDVTDSDSNVFTYSVEYTISEPSISLSVQSPQYEGTPVTISAVGGESYKFYYELNGEKTIIQDTSEVSSCTWTPSEAGEYKLFADITTANGETVVRAVSFTVNASKWFTASPESKQEVGAETKLEAFSVDGLFYNFYYKKASDSTWTTIQNYSSAASCTWTPAEAGSYTLYVDVLKSTGDTVTMSMDYKVVDYLEPFKASLPSPQPIGAEIELTAQGGYQYRFYYESNGKWVNIQSFSTSNTCTWIPAEARDYIIYAEVKNESGTIVGTYRIPYTVTDPYTLSIDKENVQNVGTTLTLSSSGGSSYKFYYEYNGAWCKIQDSESSTCIWQPKYEGNYMLYVDIRDESGKTVTCRTCALELYDLFTFTTSAYSTTLPCGTSIDLSAGGGEQYKFYYEKSGTWVRIQNFSEADTCTWTPGAVGKYNVYVDIKDESGQVVNCKRITFNITDPYTFTASVQSPQNIGASVKLSASGGKTYKFYYEKNGEWVKIQAFSSAATCVWKPTESGRYMLYVDIADASNNVIAYKAMEYIIGTVDDSEYSFTTSVESPQPMNTSVTLSANGGSSYKFYYEIGGKWATIQNFSTANTCTWTPDMIDTYKLYVDIKDSSGNVVKTLSKSFTATDPYGFTVSKSSPQDIGTTVTLTANGGSSYKFYYQYQGAWVKIQDSTTGTCDWRPNKAGTYLLYVDIKNASGTVVTCRTVEITFNDPFSFTTTASSLTQPTGTAISLAADGGESYKFYYEKDGAWVRIQNFSTDDTCTWTPTQPGKYNLFCDIKDASGSVAVCKRITFNITERCTISADKTEADLGEKITLTATGGTQYKFYYELDGAWVRIQSYSTANTCQWTPTTAGDYMVYVDVQDANGTVIACKGVQVAVG